MILRSWFFCRGPLGCPLVFLSLFLFIPIYQTTLPKKYSLLQPDDIKVVALDPSRVRRSLPANRAKSVSGSTKHLAFKALDREFNLAIWPNDVAQKHPNMIIDVPGFQRLTPQNLTSVFFSGIDSLEPESSSVNFYVDHIGLITGSIHYESSIDDVYLEPSWRHDVKEELSSAFGSILVYNESENEGSRDANIFPYEEFSHKCMEDETARTNSNSTSENYTEHIRSRRG